jgi:hypothetical protein
MNGVERNLGGSQFDFKHEVWEREMYMRRRYMQRRGAMAVVGSS